MLSGAALLACGQLVFGRSRRMQRGTRDLMPARPYQIASGFFSRSDQPDAPFSEVKSEDPTDPFSGLGDIQPNTYPKVAFSILDISPETKLEGPTNFNVPDTSPASNSEEPDLDAYLDLAVSSDQPPSPPKASRPDPPNVDSSSRAIAIANSESSESIQNGRIKSFTPDDQLDTSIDFWKSFPSSTDIANSIPIIDEQTMSDLKDQASKFCFWELSDDKSEFVPTVCGPSTSTWADFKTADDDSKPGFGVFVANVDTVYFRISTIHECESKHADRNWYVVGYPCQSEDEELIYNRFTTEIQPAIAKVFSKVILIRGSETLHS